MNHPKLTILRNTAKMLSLLLVIAGTAVASFATLGDKNKNSSRAKSSLLSSKTYSNSFSLRSGYTYRGNQVISTDLTNRYINLNTTVSYSKGNTTFIVPLKKKMILNNVRIDIGNRQFKRN